MYGSQPVDGSPYLFAVFHVLPRRLVPRHPPYALCSLIVLSFSLHKLPILDFFAKDSYILIMTQRKLFILIHITLLLSFDICNILCSCQCAMYLERLLKRIPIGYCLSTNAPLFYTIHPLKSTTFKKFFAFSPHFTPFYPPFPFAPV